MEYLACQMNELTENSPLVVELDGVQIGLILHEGSIYAYENRCAHQGGPVCLGEVLGKVMLKIGEDQTAIGEYVSQEECHLVCPWHGFEYDLKTGRCVGDHRLHLNKYEVSIRGNDVFVHLEPKKS